MPNVRRPPRRAAGPAVALVLLASILFCGPALAQGTTYIGGAGGPSVRVDLSVLDALGPEPTLPQALRGTLPGAAPAAGGRTSVLRPPSTPATRPAALKPPTPAATKEAAKPTMAEPTDAEPKKTTPKLTAPKKEPAAKPERAQAVAPARALPEAAPPPPAPTAVLRPPPAPARTAPPAPAAAPALPSVPPTPPAAPPVVAPQQMAAVAPPSPPPAATAPAAPAAAPAAPAATRPPAPPTQTASLPPGGGLPTRERPFRIRFADQSTDLPEQAKSALNQLAQRLKDNEAPRIQLIAYAAGTAETASQARRLSLSRALALRTYLIDQGVRGNRMDVRALGNKLEDDGPADRVDIVVADR